MAVHESQAVWEHQTLSGLRTDDEIQTPSPCAILTLKEKQVTVSDSIKANELSIQNRIPSF